MHNTNLATNLYALTALTCTWALLGGTLVQTNFRYASYLAVMIFNALIYSQFSYARTPGATGTLHYYTARLSEYGIGIALALLATLADPWWVCWLREPPLISCHGVLSRSALQYVRFACECIHQAILLSSILLQLLACEHSKQWSAALLSVLAATSA